MLSVKELQRKTVERERSYKERRLACAFESQGYGIEYYRL